MTKEEARLALLKNQAAILRVEKMLARLKFKRNELRKPLQHATRLNSFEAGMVCEAIAEWACTVIGYIDFWPCTWKVEPETPLDSIKEGDEFTYCSWGETFTDYDDNFRVTRRDDNGSEWQDEQR